MRPLVAGFDNRAGHHWAAPAAGTTVEVTVDARR